MKFECMLFTPYQGIAVDIFFRFVKGSKFSFKEDSTGLTWWQKHQQVSDLSIHCGVGWQCWNSGMEIGSPGLA